jgi:hypothetical protein
LRKTRASFLREFASFNHRKVSLALFCTLYKGEFQRKRKSATFEFLLINIARLVSFHSFTSIKTFVKAPEAKAQKKNGIFVVEFSFFILATDAITARIEKKKCPARVIENLISCLARYVSVMVVMSL